MSQIDQASNQVSAGAQALSQGAAEQASSVVGEIGKFIKTIADMRKA